MNILFVSQDLIAGDVAYSLTKVGHSVKLHVDGEHCRHNLHDLIAKTKDWRKELSWVGKKGLIIFDGVGYGAAQDKLRSKGYNVFGGSLAGDVLVHDHVFGQQKFAEHGMKVRPAKSFVSVDQALRFARKHRRAWVVRTNGPKGNASRYVGVFDDGRDVLDVLNDMKTAKIHGVITLQEKITGEEITVTSIFNGKDWIGPPLLSVEHRKFMAGDVGPGTGDMGCVGWYETLDRKGSLFADTLNKLKPYLQIIGYRGAISMSIVANERGAFPVSVSCRASSAIVHLQTELNDSPWAELLLAAAKGEAYSLSYKPGVGIAVVIAVPPYPFNKKAHVLSSSSSRIYFNDAMSVVDRSHIHYEEVSFDKKRKCLYVSGSRGHALYVTANGLSIEDARTKAYAVIGKIVISKMMYRDDIGEHFAKVSRKQLRKWGFIY